MHSHSLTHTHTHTHTHTLLCHLSHLTVCTYVSLLDQTRKSVSSHSHWTNAWPKHNLISVKGISIVQNNLLNPKRLSGHKLWIWLKWQPGLGATDGLCPQKPTQNHLSIIKFTSARNNFNFDTINNIFFLFILSGRIVVVLKIKRLKRSSLALDLVK